jgi:pyridoxal phosphate enzyme (YggS family)
MSATPNLADPPSSLGHGLQSVRARIAAAAERAGRAAQHVTLVAVSKTHPADRVQAAIDAGQHVFGENRVQEAAAKFLPLRSANPTLRLHLIGALQTNKAEEAVRIADVIESLDRPRLADAIATAADRVGHLPDLLIQVNIGDEPQKAGVSTADADAFIRTSIARFGSALRGLMCIPPEGQDPEPYFRRLADMRAAHGLPLLSMGMSGDFEVAIACGATHVRVGSAIFGHRAIPLPTAPQSAPT